MTRDRVLGCQFLRKGGKGMDGNVSTGSIEIYFLRFCKKYFPHGWQSARFDPGRGIAGTSSRQIHILLIYLPSGS